MFAPLKDFSFNFNPSTALLPSMRNLLLALLDLRIRTISVSTTFSFIDGVVPPRCRRVSETHQLPRRSHIAPITGRNQLLFPHQSLPLQHLRNQLRNLGRIRLVSGKSVQFRQRRDHRSEVLQLVRYDGRRHYSRDGVSGQENVPVIVAEIGWPSEAEVGAQAQARTNSELE